MAIRFPCSECRQLLGIASRKAGTEIQCPKCGHSQVVPTAEEAAAALEAERSPPAKANGEDASGIVVYDDEPEEEAADAGEPSAPEPARPIAVAPPEEEPAPLAVAPALRPVPSDMVLLHRRTLYLQAIVILAVGAGGFAGGYFMGRGDATVEEQVRREQAEKTPLLIEGRLLYRPDGHTVTGDDGAVVVALPAARPPERRFPAFGIRPQDPPPRETDKTVQAIVQAGGAYARADAAGRFWMQVPDQGQYWLLLISRRTSRPRGSEIEELVADEMKPYFASAGDLVGRAKFRWTRENVGRGMKPVEHDFGRDGE